MQREGEQSSWKWTTLQIGSLNKFHKGYPNPRELAYQESNNKGPSAPAPPLPQQPMTEKVATGTDAEGDTSA